MFLKKPFLISFIIFLIIIGGVLLFYLKTKVFNDSIVKIIPAEKSGFKAPTKVIFIEKENTDQDSDDDGLSDEEEKKIGTNPETRDTDDDGIDDKDEIRLGTDPLVSDTDGDGFSDSQEIKRGTNPLIKDN